MDKSTNRIFDNSVYNDFNYQTAKRVADLAHSYSTLENRKQFIYISAETHPPLFPGYLRTKQQAEQHISKLENLDFHSLRCGLITSDERSFLRPLGKALGCIRGIQKKSPLAKLFENAQPGDFFKNLEVPDYLELDDIANAVLFLHLNRGSYSGEFLAKEQIEVLSKKFEMEF